MECLVWRKLQARGKEPYPVCGVRSHRASPLLTMLESNLVSETANKSGALSFTNWETCGKLDRSPLMLEKEREKFVSLVRVCVEPILPSASQLTAPKGMGLVFQEQQQILPTTHLGVTNLSQDPHLEPVWHGWTFQKISLAIRVLRIIGTHNPLHYDKVLVEKKLLLQTNIFNPIVLECTVIL